jgi:hypothetical protein
LWLFAGLVLMLVTRAAEATPRVVLIAAPLTAGGGRAPSTSSAPAEIDAVPAQIQAELHAAGYDVVRLSRDRVVLDDLAAAAEAQHAIAAIGVVGAAGQAAADVWVTNKALGKTVIRHVTTDAAGSDAPRVLALQVVETLHASLVEIGARPPEQEPVITEPHPTAPKPAPEPPPTAPAPRAAIPRPRARADRPMQRSTAAPREELRFALGAAVLAGPGDLPVVPALAARVGYRFAERWTAELAWLGPARTQVAAQGSPSARASVDQELMSARLVAAPVVGTKLEPFLDAGLGLERIGATGSMVDSADPPQYRAEATSAWFPFVEVGAGGRVRVWRMLGVVAGIDAAFPFTRPAIRFGTRSRPTQWPLLFATLALEAAW